MLTNNHTGGRRVWRPGDSLVFGLLLAAVAAPGWAVEEDLAREAYLVAQNWVARNSVPAETLPVLVTDLSAVHVTLRWDGVTVGQGTALSTEVEEAKPIDVMPLVASAASQALKEARDTLALRGVVLKEPNNLVLDVQFAASMKPIHLRKLAELRDSVTLNAHGLAVEEGGRLAWSFPGNGVAANTNLDGHLNRLIAELDLRLDRKPLIGTDEGPRLYRFSVVHITRPVNGGEAVRLYRGNEPMPGEPLDDQGLVLLGEQLADHLIQRQRKDGGFAGTYEPTPDQYRPETADATATAAAVYALARASKVKSVEQPGRERAARLGLEALVQLVGRQRGDNRQVIGHDVEATAWALLALLEAPGGSEFKEARDRLVAALASMQTAEGRFRASVDPDAALTGPAAQSLSAAALVRAFDQSRDPKLLDRARRALAPLAQTGEADEYRLFPWLVIALTDLQRLEHPIDQNAALPELCERLWARQVTPWRDDAERHSPDTVGGFLVGTRLLAEPTHDSAWVLAGLAVALRDARIVSEKDRPQWLVNTGLAARFLNQLTLQPSSAYYTRNPAEAIGGTRATLYDNRQPLEATAAALLAVTELRLTLAELAK